jgi:ribosomal protein S18 acetylase RimI-like enzyme
MEILPAADGDTPKIFELYDKAIAFQQTVFDKTWISFAPEQVATEIADRRLWKIVDNGQIANIFSITYSDPILWGERSNAPAMYIHRIVTDPKFRGRGYVQAITDWAKHHAKENALRFVRMDTWSDNQKLLDYYQSFGYKFLGNITPEESDTLPPHYRGLSLALLEIDLNDDQATI